MGPSLMPLKLAARQIRQCMIRGLPWKPTLAIMNAYSCAHDQIQKQKLMGQFNMFLTFVEPPRAATAREMRDRWVVAGGRQQYWGHDAKNEIEYEFRRKMEFADDHHFAQCQQAEPRRLEELLPDDKALASAKFEKAHELLMEERAIERYARRR